MKSKNFVSLSVAASFAVLATTGLLIYFGQGNHAIDHTHAWMGILFFSGAVFHITNNWASIKGYSINRKGGGAKRELIIPVLVVALFTTGIAADWPVFKDLANAGKKLFGPKRKERGISQAAADSIARKVTADFQKALSAGDTASLAKLLTDKALVNTGDSTFKTKADVLALPAATGTVAVQVDQATTVDEKVIVSAGTVSAGAGKKPFTGVLNEAGGSWKIAAWQVSQ